MQNKSRIYQQHNVDINSKYIFCSFKIYISYRIFVIGCIYISQFQSANEIYTCGFHRTAYRNITQVFRTVTLPLAFFHKKMDEDMLGNSFLHGIRPYMLTNQNFIPVYVLVKVSNFVMILDNITYFLYIFSLIYTQITKNRKISYLHIFVFHNSTTYLDNIL